MLQAIGIKKKFGSLQAVGGLDLEINPGECLALLGPNGAGKTTTCEILEGLLEPDEGEVSLFGLSLKKNRTKILERIGVQLQETQLYKRFTVSETLELFASFYKKKASIEPLIQKLRLEDKKDTQLRHLSGGQKQRVYLATCLVNNPDLIFLDEPTTGLDPQARRVIWNLVESIKAEKRGILLTTHYMEEAEVLADRVAIIDHGKIIAEGTPAQLIQKYCGGDTLSIQCDYEEEPETDAQVAPASHPFWSQFAQNLPWVGDGKISSKATGGGSQLSVTTSQAPAWIQEILREADRLGKSINDIHIRKSTLEDVFLQLTGRTIRES